MRTALLAATVMAIGCRAAAPPSTGGPARVAGVVRSNVLRGDYAGSKACERCHKELFDEWQRAPMHNMTRSVDGAAIRAPFQDAVFQFKGDRVRLAQLGGERYMTIESKFGDHAFRVTRVIGGHHREDFAGVEVRRAEAGAEAIGPAGVERILPVSWLLGPETFRYKGYSVMVKERPGLKPGGEWNTTCIFCHNTIPYFSDILGALAGPGTPPYQGEVVDPLLPPQKRWRFEITDGEALRKALAAEAAELGGLRALDGDPGRALGQLVKLTRGRFSAKHLLEVGIGCESCHGGAAEHAAQPGVRPSFEPRSAFFVVRPHKELTREEATAQQVNRACARCHQVLFTRYPWTWEGGTRAQATGGSNINSGEGRDLLLGACASRLSCVGCHDPHAADNALRMKRLEGAEGDAVCQRCHPSLNGVEAVRAHTHHAPAGEGSRCVACHMAKKNMSLEVALARYHRIGSPTEKVRVEGDRPLECALCHAEKSVGEIVGKMEEWWGRKYDRERLKGLYGEDFGVNALEATLAKGKPHEVAVAAMVLGEKGRKGVAGEMVRQLGNEIPLVRGYVMEGLERMVGEKSGIDLGQEGGRIGEEARRWLEKKGVEVRAEQKRPGTGTSTFTGTGGAEEE